MDYSKQHAAPAEQTESRWQNLVNYLNTTGHERALWVYTAIVLAHWVEHLVQAYQIWVMGWARPASLGVLGLWQPWLVKTELLHWSYAFFMIVGLLLLRPGFLGRSRTWWTISLGIQTWHFVEHSVLQLQALFGFRLFGSEVPISIVQQWVPRVELHLFYNAAVFIPMVVAMYYHLYPPAGEAAPACGCARNVCEIPTAGASTD